jgi:hypothetical protein
MQNRIFVPTQSYKDWQRLLAKPELHWKVGYSAMTLARAWEAAPPQEFPPEVAAILGTAGPEHLRDLSLLVALPEFQVPLPGGDRPSQTDLLVLARNAKGLVAVAVEGKVDEAFGPTIGQKRAEDSRGVDERLRFLFGYLGIGNQSADSVRYQLLHRTASALLTAEQFHASAAVMLVHSFSESNKWFEDFAAFCALFNAKPEAGKLVTLGKLQAIPLYVGWCRGDQKFRAAEDL